MIDFATIREGDLEKHRGVAGTRSGTDSVEVPAWAFRFGFFGDKIKETSGTCVIDVDFTAPPRFQLADVLADSASCSSLSAVLFGVSSPFPSGAFSVLSDSGKFFRLLFRRADPLSRASKEEEENPGMLLGSAGFL